MPWCCDCLPSLTLAAAQDDDRNAPCLVGKRRLELLRLAAHDPKSCSSANSDTSPKPEDRDQREGTRTRAGCPITSRLVPLASNIQSGEPRRTRTCNPLIKSQLLYQLS